MPQPFPFMTTKPFPRTFSRPNLFAEAGLGEVVVIRAKSGGRLECGVFLVDVFCLGVKNAFFTVMEESELERFLADIFRSSDLPPEEHDGAWGRKLVESAVAYAGSLGFAPHRNYKQAARVFGGIDPKACAEVFTFGHNGKPLFIAGPHDSPEKCRRIMAMLERKRGPGGSHFIVPADRVEGWDGPEPADDPEED